MIRQCQNMVINATGRQIFAAALVVLLGVFMASSASAAQDGRDMQQDPATQSETPDDAKEKESESVYVRMTTTKGDIVLELDGAKAPKTVENFMSYVEAEFFDGTIIHRVIEQFMIQGGGFTGDMIKKPTNPGVENEWQNGLKNERGSIAMARVGNQPDSGTSQFFINVVDNPMLDEPRDGAAYAVFGKVVAGMGVVDEIRRVPVQVSPLNRREVSFPTKTIVIEKVRELTAEEAAEAIKAEKNTPVEKSQPEAQPSTTPGAGD